MPDTRNTLPSNPYPSRKGTRRRRPLIRPVVALPVAAALAVVVVVAIGLVTRPQKGAALRAPLAGGLAPTWLASRSPGSLAPPSVLPSAATPSPSAGASRCPSAGTGSCSSPAAPRGIPGGPPIKAPAGKRWALSFSEEFNGTDYDHSKLTPCFDWNDGDCTATFNDALEHYEPSQVRVSGGTAKLVAQPAASPIPSSACENGSCTYVSGLLSTARPRSDAGQRYLYAFTYGFVEARLKFPATRGFFTAFWMLPADPSYNYRSEIDILEQLGDDPTTMYMTYNYDNRNQSYPVNQSKHNNGACRAKDYSKAFVDMAVDWEPNQIAWYIDGVKCGQFTDAKQIENGPMQIILDLMVDTSWQRKWNVGLTDPTLSRQLEVDYIRVYQQHPA